MPDRWLGLVVSGAKIVAVDVEVAASGPIILQSDETWALQGGDRSLAYSVMFRRVSDYIRENGIHKVIIKASAVSRGSVTKAHLEAAELRGVVMAAAGSVTQTICSARAVISKNFGERKADEYLADEQFWKKEINGSLRAGSREAALLLLAAKE